MLGPTGLGNPFVDGFYIDDQWYNTSTGNGTQCNNSPFGGATEEDYNCVTDMGLTQQDTTDITNGWQLTMQAVFDALIANKGFSWAQFYSSGAPPQSSCTSWFESACSNSSVQYTSAMLFQYTRNNHTSFYPFPQFETDLASFLLVRGPYAVERPSFVRACLRSLDVLLSLIEGIMFHCIE